MNFSLVAALLMGLSTVCLTAVAQDGPRELGGAPTMPPAAPRAAVPARRQLATTPTPAAADSTQAAPVATAPMPGPPQPVPGPPPPPGQLMSGSSRPTRFQVGLKNGSIYNVSDVDVRSPLFGRSYLLLDGQRKVEMSEVGFYETETGHYVRAPLPGSSRETTLRREKVGRLSLYAIYTTSYSPGGFMPGYGYGGYGGYGYGGYGGTRTTKTEYFTKDNGPIQNLTARNLGIATADNAGVQTLLAKAQHYRTGIILSYVAAGGLLVASVTQSTRAASGGGISPLYYAIIPCLVVPLVLQSKQASLQRQAISLYNGER